MNERPIYLRSLYLGLALLQTALHLGFDYDAIVVRVSNPPDATSSNEHFPAPANPVEQMKSRALKLLAEIGLISLGSVILGPILYSLTVRKTAWRTSLACARFLGWDIPGSAELSYIPPYHITLIFRSLISGFFLLLLWQGSNLTFNAYVAQEPLKRDQPLTQESNDPNGSLINGLKSKKQVVQVKSSTSYFRNLLTPSSDLRLLGISKDQQAVPRTSCYHLQRYRPPRWTSVVADIQRMPQNHSRNHNSYLHIRKRPHAATTTNHSPFAAPIPPPPRRPTQRRAHLP